MVFIAKKESDFLETGVYKITNIVTDKIYVGSTSTSFKKRYSEHVNTLSTNTHYSKYLQNSWNKHGSDNFKFTILEICSAELCIEKEQFWLDKLRSYDNTVGYNLLIKAGSSLGYKHTEESLVLIGQRSIERGFHINSIKAMQAANIGSKRTQEHCQIISETHSVPVIQLTLDGAFVKEWDSMVQATLGIGLKLSDHNISKCANGECKSVSGFLWIKKYDYDPTIQYKYNNERGKVKSKPVYQYTLDNILVKEWFSSSIASRELNINVETIYKAIKNNKPYKNFKWLRNKID